MDNFFQNIQKDSLGKVEPCKESFFYLEEYNKSPQTPLELWVIHVLAFLNSIPLKHAI